ncbi:hypothetical protein CANCADRAFT_106434 [Tortispora caseinolytica NRRL Y-17796]|uniref:Exocyst complex component SEC15 n=1 Tax=Tortispora caseinolytica NRRL Y-17796 TaxID=767744 RepID=A0A1E4TF71_9ASCO|nr:hypothetical protein CANCADRAFT_106434 [Tortispora caseinolytica NRRL Y-17796]
MSFESQVERALGASIVESDFAASVETLAPLFKDAIAANNASGLLKAFDYIVSSREDQIQALSDGNYPKYVEAVTKLVQARDISNDLHVKVNEVENLILNSGMPVVEKRKQVFEAKKVHNKLEEAQSALKTCLTVLNMLNQAEDLVESEQFAGALEELNNLQSLHLDSVSQYSFGRLVAKSIPALRNAIRETVLKSMRAWLHQSRKISPGLGKRAFAHTKVRKAELAEIVKGDPTLEGYAINSSVEYVLSESSASNESLPIDSVDFTPLLQSLHIYSLLGLNSEFRAIYESDRKFQRQFVLPTTLSISEPDASDLRVHLETLAGFMIIERETARKTRGFWSQTDLEDFWVTACQRMTTVLVPSMQSITDPKIIVNIREVFCTFVQTIEYYGFSASPTHHFLYALFEKYSSTAKREFADSFKANLREDDYMPMVVSNSELWNIICSVSWYTPPPSVLKPGFPRPLPFSQLYPLTCASMRNFIHDHAVFLEDYGINSNTADLLEVLRTAVDDVLINVVCKSLEQQLLLESREQIVQVLVNLEYFINAARQIEQHLFQIKRQYQIKQFQRDKTMGYSSGRVPLKAVAAFRETRKKAESRVFELVNSKVDDFLDIAEYEWTTPQRSDTVSTYLTEMVNFLETLVDSTLNNLPTEVKSLIYFDAFDHLASSLLKMLLNSGKRITFAALMNFDQDLTYIEKFVSNIADQHSKAGAGTGTSIYGKRQEDDNGLDDNKDAGEKNHIEHSLTTTFLELRQCVDLLRSEDSDYNDINIRMKKYSRVKPKVAGILLEMKANIVDGEIPVEEEEARQGSFARVKNRATNLGKYYARRAHSRSASRDLDN